MYLADLSPFPEYDEIKTKGIVVRSVGWLSPRHPFAQGVVTEAFLDRLWVHCRNSMMATLGYHECPYCTKKNFGIGTTWKKKTITLGSAEIRVLSAEGVVYAAPNLIFHYVVGHHYCPPEEFIQAVLHGPQPRSPEYERYAASFRDYREPLDGS